MSEFDAMLDEYRDQGFKVKRRKELEHSVMYYVSKPKRSLMGWDIVCAYFVDGDADIAHMIEFLEDYKIFYKDDRLEPTDKGLLVVSGTLDEEEFRKLKDRLVIDDEVRGTIQVIHYGAETAPRASPEPKQEKIRPPVPVPTPASERVYAQRGGQIKGGEYLFSVKVVNDTPYNITNVAVTLLSYPLDCLSGSQGVSQVKTVNLIEAHKFVSKTFSFSPTMDCVAGTIKATVAYVDHRNETQTIKVDPQEIREVCGLLKPVVVNDSEFDQSIRNWQSSGTDVEIKGTGAEVIQEEAADILRENNFYVIPSMRSLTERGAEGAIRGFAQGKYQGKRLGVVIRVREAMEREGVQVRIETSAEDDAMILPTLQEIKNRIDLQTLLLTTGIQRITTEISKSRSEQEMMSSLLNQVGGRISEMSAETREMLVVLSEVGARLDATLEEQNRLTKRLVEASETFISKQQLDESLRGKLKKELRDATKEGLKSVAKWGLITAVKIAGRAFGIPVPDF